MSYRLIYTECYKKRARHFLKQHPELVSILYQDAAIACGNPQHPSLRLHRLSGKLDGVYSVSINLSYRITLEMLITEQEIIPINVGDHDAVYR
jgi:plasmid maintenance system killer protein